jgi:hypothetical protein
MWIPIRREKEEPKDARSRDEHDPDQADDIPAELDESFDHRDRIGPFEPHGTHARLEHDLPEYYTLLCPARLI